MVGNENVYSDVARCRILEPYGHNALLRFSWRRESNDFSLTLYGGSLPNSGSFFDQKELIRLAAMVGGRGIDGE